MEALIKGFAPVILVETRKGADRGGRSQRSQEVEIFAMDVQKALSLLENRGRLLTWFSPIPYGIGWVGKDGFQEFPLRAVTKDKGIFVLEHTKREEIVPAQWEGWYFQTRTYGDTSLTFKKND